MQVGTIFLGKYKIIKRLGKGGMGTVYLAKNENLGNYLAIKKIEKVGSKIDIKTEQKILTELNHPSIVKIFDVAEDNRNIYLIEEYIDGCTLGDVLYKEDKYGNKVELTAIDEEVVIEWAKQIAEALNYLHTRTPYPIIYRDLKLGNIMLDSNGKIKIIDFGIAKADTKDNSNNNNNGLTYLFAAPEQKQSGIANVKTDIYSFGVVLYILALGNKAKITKIYNERAKREVNQLIVEDIRELNPNLSVGLSMIIKRCLEEQPSKRYENVKELIRDLNNIYKYDNKYKSLVKKRYLTIASAVMCLAGFAVLTKAGVRQLDTEKIEKYNIKIEEGQSYFNEGSYDVALSAFRDAIEIIPHNTEAYREIGVMYFKTGDYDTCISYLEQAFLEETRLYKDADCIYILGSAYFKKEDYLSAISRFESAVSINPTAVNYLRDLAVSYARNENIEKAKETLERLKDEKAQEDITNYVRGEILLKEGNIQEAIESFNLSLDLATTDEIKTKSIISIAEIYRDYSDYLSSGIVNEEIAILEKSQNVLEEKNNLVITEMLAKAYYDKAIETDSREYYEKSINSFNTLLSLGYRRPYIYRNIAIIYQQQLSDYESAEDILLKMKEVYPQDVGCYTQLALLNIEIENNKEKEVRDYSKAYNYYEQALKYSNGSNDSSLQQLMGLIGELKDNGWIN